jgi:hypothetical protein
MDTVLSWQQWHSPLRLDAAAARATIGTPTIAPAQRQANLEVGRQER